MYIIKEHETLTDNLSIKTYINKISTTVKLRGSKEKRQKEIKIVTVFSQLELNEIELIY